MGERSRALAGSRRQEDLLGVRLASADHGALRRDIDPADVIIGISGVSLAAGASEQREQAGRLLDLLLDGLRYGPPDRQRRRAAQT
jgi:hypothetical protein